MLALRTSTLTERYCSTQGASPNIGHRNTANNMQHTGAWLTPLHIPKVKRIAKQLTELPIFATISNVPNIDVKVQQALSLCCNL